MESSRNSFQLALRVQHVSFIAKRITKGTVRDVDSVEASLEQGRADSAVAPFDGGRVGHASERGRWAIGPRTSLPGASHALVTLYGLLAD